MVKVGKKERLTAAGSRKSTKGRQEKWLAVASLITSIRILDEKAGLIAVLLRIKNSMESS